MGRKDCPFTLITLSIFSLWSSTVFFSKGPSSDNILRITAGADDCDIVRGRRWRLPSSSPSELSWPCSPWSFYFYFCSWDWEEKVVSLCSCTITLPIRSSCGLDFYLRFSVRGIVYYIICYVMTVIFTINCFFIFMVFRSQKVPKETKKGENPFLFLRATI